MPLPTFFFKQHMNHLIPIEFYQLVRAKGFKIIISLPSQVIFAEINLLLETCYRDNLIEFEKSIKENNHIYFSRTDDLRKEESLARFFVLIRDNKSDLKGCGDFIYNKATRTLELETLMVSFKNHSCGIGKIIIATGFYLSRYLDTKLFKVFPIDEARNYYKRLNIKDESANGYLSRELGLCSDAFTNIIKELKPSISSLSPW